MRNAIRTFGIMGWLFCVFAFNLSCNKKPVVVKTATVTDADGHRYETIKIGRQLWMKQNLRVGQFADGKKIPLNPVHDIWSKNTTGSCSNYDGNPKYDAVYGKLYNYYALLRGIKLPKGWRISTIADWQELNSYLDVNKSISANKLKTVDGWVLHPNADNTNTTGFSALPAGLRNEEYTYDEILKGAYFWILPRVNKFDNPMYNVLSYNSSNMNFLCNLNEHYGMSVRLIHE